MTPYEHLVVEMADRITERSVNRCLRRLQALRDGLQLGEDTGLISIWDEVCVQVQTERTIVWWAYESTIRSIVMGELEDLEAYELKAVWLETPPGENWAADEGVSERPVYCLDDIEDHIYGALLAKAANFSNARIRAFIDR